MAISLPVYKKRRVVLVRFKRAKTGNPEAERPDIDDRGYVSNRGPVLGLAAGTTSIVRLVRERIDDKASLWVRTTDGGAFVITDPAIGQLPNTTEMDIKLTGIVGANPKTAKLEVRHGTVTGPIIHYVHAAWLLKPLLPLLDDPEPVVRVGVEELRIGPAYLRVCDLALNLAVDLTGFSFSFQTGPRVNYTAAQIDEVRRFLQQLP